MNVILPLSPGAFWEVDLTDVHSVLPEWAGPGEQQKVQQGLRGGELQEVGVSVCACVCVCVSVSFQGPESSSIVLLNAHPTFFLLGFLRCVFFYVRAGKLSERGWEWLVE